MSASDMDFMQRCFALAEAGRYSARPNPVVGCVIVKDGQIIGEGFHLLAGQAHAEINALAGLGEQARGATLYVSLEPCNFQGKTGPCTAAVIKSRVARVVYGMQDPNPLVAGQGLAELEKAGISVSGPVLEQQARALNPGFIKRMHEGLPYVRCKLAMSLDGRTAMASGESKWITGAQARADVQKLRARSCAVLTGIETIIHDDPSLTARLEGQNYKQPIRIIADSTLRMPDTAKTLKQPGSVLVACALEAKEIAGTIANRFGANLQAESFPAQSGRVDLEAVLRYLASAQQCNEVLLEAGPELSGSMLRLGLVDEIVTYIAPKIMGHDAKPLFKLPGMASLEDSIQLEFMDVVMLGKDCRMRSRVIYPE